MVPYKTKDLDDAGQTKIVDKDYAVTIVLKKGT